MRRRIDVGMASFWRHVSVGLLAYVMWTKGSLAGRNIYFQKSSNGRKDVKEAIDETAPVSFLCRMRSFIGNVAGYTVCWAIWQNEQNEDAPSEDSDQPGHSPSLFRDFAVRSVGNYGPKK